MLMETYTIDATNKKLGRIATEAAMVLRGKDRPDFTPNKLPDVNVHIVNAAQVDLEGRMDEVYDRYSGYPGGRKEIPRGRLIEKKGYEPVFQLAVRGMLPNNKLRAVAMKRLMITE